MLGCSPKYFILFVFTTLFAVYNHETPQQMFYLYKTSRLTSESMKGAQFRIFDLFPSYRERPPLSPPTKTSTNLGLGLWFSDQDQDITPSSVRHHTSLSLCLLACLCVWGSDSWRIPLHPLWNGFLRFLWMMWLGDLFILCCPLRVPFAACLLPTTKSRHISCL